MPFTIIREDITKVTADAIVNSANPDVRVGRGVDGAIHQAAGPRLLEARARIGPMRPGEAAMTPAFGLSAKFVIHTVGPDNRRRGGDEENQLRNCYRRSLRIAQDLGCESIAFPLISTGAYRFPKSLALQIAASEIRAFLLEQEMEVILVVYDMDSFILSSGLLADSLAGSQLQYSQAGPLASALGGQAKYSLSEQDAPIMGGVSDYMASEGAPVLDDAFDINWVPQAFSKNRFEEDDGAESSAPEVAEPERPVIMDRTSAAGRGRAAMEMVPGKDPEQLWEDLDHLLDSPRHGRDSFSTHLLRLADKSGMTDPEIYRGANMDRKLFSKIRSNPDYQPSKGTVLSLAISLRLSLDETRDLLRSAGFDLSPVIAMDIIVRYFIEHGIYDIFTLNFYLFGKLNKTI